MLSTIFRRARRAPRRPQHAQTATDAKRLAGELNLWRCFLCGLDALAELDDNGVLIEDFAPVYAMYRKLLRAGLRLDDGFVRWMEEWNAAGRNKDDDSDADDADKLLDSQGESEGDNLDLSERFIVDESADLDATDQQITEGDSLNAPPDRSLVPSEADELLAHHFPVNVNGRRVWLSGYELWGKVRNARRRGRIGRIMQQNRALMLETMRQYQRKVFIQGAMRLPTL